MKTGFSSFRHIKSNKTLQTALFQAESVYSRVWLGATLNTEQPISLSEIYEEMNQKVKALPTFRTRIGCRGTKTIYHVEELQCVGFKNYCICLYPYEPFWNFHCSFKHFIYQRLYFESKGQNSIGKNCTPTTVTLEKRLCNLSKLKHNATVRSRFVSVTDYYADNQWLILASDIVREISPSSCWLLCW